MRVALALLAVSSLSAAACGGSSSSAVPCDQVIDHLMEISKSLYQEGGAPAATPDDRARMIQACEQHDGADQRACELAAKDIDTYFACDEKK